MDNSEFNRCKSSLVVLGAYNADEHGTILALKDDNGRMGMLFNNRGILLDALGCKCTCMTDELSLSSLQVPLHIKCEVLDDRIKGGFKLNNNHRLVLQPLLFQQSMFDACGVLGFGLIDREAPPEHKMLLFFDMNGKAMTEENGFDPTVTQKWGASIPVFSDNEYVEDTLGVKVEKLIQRM